MHPALLADKILCYEWFLYVYKECFAELIKYQFKCKFKFLNQFKNLFVIV